MHRAKSLSPYINHLESNTKVPILSLLLDATSGKFLLESTPFPPLNYFLQMQSTCLSNTTRIQVFRLKDT